MAVYEHPTIGAAEVDAHRAEAASGTTYAYDATGNLTSYTDHAGTVTYGYNPVNNVTALSEPGSGCNVASPTAACVRFEYDDNDRPTKSLFPGGTTETAEYLATGQVKLLRAERPGSTFTHYTATYSLGVDDTTRRRTLTDHLSGITTTYDYDPLGRLTSADASSGDDYGYDYDAAGIGRSCASTES